MNSSSAPARLEPIPDKLFLGKLPRYLLPREKSWSNSPWKISPESYRHYSVVAVHGWDICRVVLRLPGETLDGLAGRRAPKSDMENGWRRREEDCGPAHHWRRWLSINSQSGRGLPVKGLSKLLIPGLRNVAWKNPRRNKRLLLLRRK